MTADTRIQPVAQVLTADELVQTGGGFTLIELLPVPPSTTQSTSPEWKYVPVRRS
jgi:hypothetical protein